MIEQRFIEGLRRTYLRGLAVVAAVLALCFTALGAAEPAFAYEKATTSIPIEVKVSGDTTSVYPDFTVSIVGQDAASSAALDKTSFTVNGAGEGSFSVSATEPVEYTYTVTEAAGTAKRWSFDDSVYQVVVQFWNDNSNTLVPHVFVEKLGADGKKAGMADSCTFDNVCSTEALTLSDPPVSKHISGDTPSAKQTFAFDFEALDGAPLPEGAQNGKVVVTIDGEGTAELGQVSFTKPGTYVYRCYEETGDAEGYTYDKTVYTVTYVVTETVDDLECARTITKDNGEQAEGLDFTNSYKKPVEVAKNPNTSDATPVGTMQVIAVLGVAAIAIALVARFGKHKNQD